jgi:hypothetical protein
VELKDLLAVARESNITFKQGDILFIRVGFTEAYNALSPAQQENFPERKPGGLLGVEATMDSLRWVWETGFAAVASDSPSFERGPTTGPYNDPDVSFHQWGLAGWGMPLGEMFDLDELAKACEERKRWTFFMCSLPMRVSVLLSSLMSWLIRAWGETGVLTLVVPTDTRGSSVAWKCGGHLVMMSML